MTAALALLAVIGWALFLCAAIGGNAIRDGLRRRIDGLNGECARRGAEITRLEGVQDHLAAELHAARQRQQMRVVPLADNETAGRILDHITRGEAKRALDNDERIHGWLQQPTRPGGDAS